jgi:hypothetical protein
LTRILRLMIDAVIKKLKILTDGLILSVVSIVRYHTGGSMKLNAGILHLAYMVYL